MEGAGQRTPRPDITVFVGGNSGPYLFDRRSASDLARLAQEMAIETGGSLLVTTSARTQREAYDALTSELTRPSKLHFWTKDSIENPFFGFLGLADRVIVTGDSVSMMTEACFTGKPVYLYDTGEGKTSMRKSTWLDGGNDFDATASPGQRLDRKQLKAYVYRHTMQLGPQRLTRDSRIEQRLLIDSGRAVWLGEGHPNPNPPPLRCVERAVERVQALFTDFKT